MFCIPDSVTNLYAGTQALLNKSQRAWEAACAAWSEVPDDSAAELSLPPPEFIVENHDRAIEHAQCVAEEPVSDSRLILWTDASAGGASGWAVVFRDSFDWVRITARGPRGASSDISELQAISLALDYAIQFVERKTENNFPLRVLEIYTDSRAAMRLLQKEYVDPMTPATYVVGKSGKRSKKERMIAQRVSLKIKELQEVGVYIEFHWVKRNKILGHILADKGAGFARLGLLCNYTLSNASIEFLPAGPLGKQEEDETSVYLDYVQATVQQTDMAKEVALTLRGRVAQAEEILATTAKHEEWRTEAAEKGTAEEVEVTGEVDFWQDDNFPIDAMSWNKAAEGMLICTEEEMTEPAEQRERDAYVWQDDALPIDTRLYLSMPEGTAGLGDDDKTIVE